METHVETARNARFQLPQILSDELGNFPFKRIIPECIRPELEASNFIQVLDLVPDRAAAKRLIIGDAKTGHYSYSSATIGEALETARNQGIDKFCVRLLSGPGMSVGQLLASHCEDLAKLRTMLGRESYIIVDPFALGLNPDLTWGVKKNGALDVEASLQLIFDSARAFAHAGISSYLTLGRLNYEVGVAKQGVETTGAKVEICSFSTNSETINAYAGHAGATLNKNTGQKIIYGNYEEMVIRGIVDAMEGSTFLINKPIEHTQVNALLQQIFETRDTSILFRIPECREAIERSGYVRQVLKEFETADLPDIKLGSYVVSGTYRMFDDVKNKYGAETAFRLLNESFLNATFTNGTGTHAVMDRNASWFLDQKRHFGA